MPVQFRSGRESSDGPCRLGSMPGPSRMLSSMSVSPTTRTVGAERFMCTSGGERKLSRRLIRMILERVEIVMSRSPAPAAPEISAPWSHGRMFIDSQLGRRIHGRPEFRLDARSLVCRLPSAEHSWPERNKNYRSNQYRHDPIPIARSCLKRIDHEKAVAEAERMADLRFDRRAPRSN